MREKSWKFRRWGKEIECTFWVFGALNPHSYVVAGLGGPAANPQCVPTLCVPTIYYGYLLPTSVPTTYYV